MDRICFANIFFFYSSERFIETYDDKCESCDFVSILDCFFFFLFIYYINNIINDFAIYKNINFCNFDKLILVNCYRDYL